MGNEYPDVLGDLVDAKRRFEFNGVHYVAALEPASVAPGETTALRLWLQSCWDMPVDASITVNLATHPSPGLAVIQKRTDVRLEAAEVGEVMIPIACSPDVEPGLHAVPVSVGVRFRTRGLYVRSQKNEGQMGKTLLSFETGMSLSATMGLGFAARTRAEQELSLRVGGSPTNPPLPDLTPTFLSHWTVADLPIQGKARAYVNDQRIYLQPKLTRQALYLAFLEESRERFKDASLPLQIGEAVFLAKILTHTVEYFCQQPGWQDAILIPAYNLAFRYNLPVDDPVFLIVRADYARITRMAVSFSFGLLRQRVGRDIWTVEEQLAVANLLADRVERGGTLPAEFLYLPLLLGGLLVGSKVQMPGEELEQSLKLLAKARRQRAHDLDEIPELTSILDRLLGVPGDASPGF